MQSLLTRLLLGGGGGFSPAALFSSGAEGVWYDPSDTSTLFQDPAGTTPVTAVEQPVGLMLDKSKGLVLGPELVTNGDFSNDTTGWSFQANATGSVVAGELQVVLAGSNNRATYQNETTVAGRWYKATATLRSASGQLSLSALDGVTVLATSGAVNATGSNQTFTIYFLATSTTTGIYFGQVGVGSTTTYFADNISVRELPGNHAISYNDTTARPTLSARVNLLTYSEQFDNPAWTKRGTATAANTTAVTAPDGTNTADIIQNLGASGIDDLFQQNSTVALDAAISPSFYIYKISATGTLRLQSPVANARGVWLINLALLSSGWERITATHPAVTISTAFTGSGAANNGLLFAAQSGGPLSFYIWGADLRVSNIGSAVPSYQRIAAATDYDTNGFPKYLYFAGVDDGMSTPANLDLTSTDKVTVFAGVRKLSDAGQAILYELSTDTFFSNGAFLLWAPSGAAAANYYARVRGSLVSNAVTPASYAAPITNVATLLANIAGDSVNVRLNGASAITSTSDLGTGNFGTYPLYIGARNNSSLWFNGYLYGLTVVGAQLTTPQIESMESWTAGKTGLQL